MDFKCGCYKILNSLKNILKDCDLSQIDGELYLELLSIKSYNCKCCSNDLLIQSQQLESSSVSKVQPKLRTNREKIKELIKENKDINTISKIVNLKKMTVENYIVKILEEDNDIDIDLDYFGITEDYEMEIKNAIKKVGTDKLRPIKDIINKNITYLQIKICILIIKIEGEEEE